MYSGANMLVNSKAGSNEVPSIGTVLTIPCAVGTIPDPTTWNCDTAEEVIELCEAIVSLTECDDGVEYEWNNQDGWDYVSDDEEVINEWCLIWKGERADSNEEVQGVFHEAVLREYQTRPKVYSSYSLDQLIDYWSSEYQVGDKCFIRDTLASFQEPRVKTTEEEEE